MKPSVFVGVPIDTAPQYPKNAVELQRAEVLTSLAELLAEMLILRHYELRSAAEGVLFDESTFSTFTRIMRSALPKEERGDIITMSQKEVERTLQEAAVVRGIDMTLELSHFVMKSGGRRVHTAPYVSFKRIT